MYNTQTAYEAIRRYFNRDGAVLAKSTAIDEPSCSYRTADGNGCAVGCLIPAEAYSEEMERRVFNDEWLRSFPFMAGLLYGVDKKFLRAAQILHDQVAESPSQFVRALDALALASGLDLSPLAQFSA